MFLLSPSLNLYLSVFYSFSLSLSPSPTLKKAPLSMISSHSQHHSTQSYQIVSDHVNLTKTGLEEDVVPVDMNLFFIRSTTRNFCCYSTANLTKAGTQPLHFATRLLLFHASEWYRVAAFVCGRLGGIRAQRDNVRARERER